MPRERSLVPGVIMAMAAVFIGFPVLICSGCLGLGLLMSGSPSDPSDAAISRFSPSADDGSEEPEPPKKTDWTIEAQTAAEKHVRRYLKFPHDASFGWGMDVAENDDQTGFLVTGTVKAPNAFGAHLTHEWGVIMERNGGRWDLLKCVIGDEIVFHDAAAMEAMKQRRAGETPVHSHLPTKPDGSEWEFSDAPDSGVGEATENVLGSINAVNEAAKEELKRRQDAKDAAAKQERDRAQSAIDAKTRTWQTADGQYRVEATFITAIAGDVQLKRTDTGDVITVKMEQLSADDQDFIENRRWLDAGR